MAITEAYIVPDEPVKRNSDENPERKPWPMKYIVLMVVIFIFLFNLYLFLFEG